MRNCKYCNLAFSDDIHFRQVAGHVANCKANPRYSERNKTISEKLTKQRKLVELECKKCEVKFSLNLTDAQIKNERYAKFCSRSCANSHTRSEESKRKTSFVMGGKGVPKKHLNAGNCEICQKYFDSGKKLFHHLKRMHGRWESLGSDRSRKRRLIEELGHRCKVCENTEWMSKQIPIEIDHIDGNPENNEKENLRLICPNCHAQTETYKGRNIGKVENSKRKQKLKGYYGKYR